MKTTEIACKANELVRKWIEKEYYRDCPALMIEKRLRIIHINKPYADFVTREEDGRKYFFEVKGTEKEKNNFGAITITECKQALLSPGRYFFLLVNINKNLTDAIQVFTLDDLLESMSIPPYKVNFNIRDNTKKELKNSKKEEIKQTINYLIRDYEVHFGDLVTDNEPL